MVLTLCCVAREIVYETENSATKKKEIFKKTMGG